MKKYQVILTSEAEKDIFDIYDYIAKKDALQNAEYVLDNQESSILSLEKTPERGHLGICLLGYSGGILWTQYLIMLYICDGKISAVCHHIMELGGVSL